MNHAQVDKIAKSKTGKRYRISDGLYLKTLVSGGASWYIRLKINNKRPTVVLGRYGRNEGEMLLAEAKAEAAKIRQMYKEGKNPKVEAQKRVAELENTVNAVALHYLKEHTVHLKHPHIPYTTYNKHICNILGHVPVAAVTTLLVRDLVKNVNGGATPSTMRKVLTMCKNILDHAVELGLINNNVASAIKPRKIAGKETARERNLSFAELAKALEIFRQHNDVMTRNNYLVIVLLLHFGVRKNELLQAKWVEFDLNNKVWELPASRCKTGLAIAIPIPDKVIPILVEARQHSAHSDYLFPCRKNSSQTPYVNSCTINKAIAKLFGLKTAGKNSKPRPNEFAGTGIDYFTVHDLRRTCASRLAELKVDGMLIERCLNHKMKGVAGTYNRYAYLDERREALNKLADKLSNCWQPHTTCSTQSVISSSKYSANYSQSINFSITDIKLNW